MAPAKTAAKAPPHSQKVQAKAREIHRCPEGYTGPCWGPTYEDVHRAAELVNAEHD